jgi:hypothetical protein
MTQLPIIVCLICCGIGIIITAHGLYISSTGYVLLGATLFFLNGGSLLNLLRIDDALNK